MSFQIHALPSAPFEDLFALSDAALAQANIVKVIADTSPGFPCRVSLEDAKTGETLLLLNYQHLDGNTPYAASHAIYVRQNVQQAQVKSGEVPEVLSRRLLSVRGFDRAKLMVDADVVDGHNLGAKLDAFFTNPAVTCVHIHNAKQGCFAASATRA